MDAQSTDDKSTDAKSADAGRQQFLISCGVCHTAEKDAPNRQGPNLHGVFGRKAGQKADFQYSKALAGADLTWTEATLDHWIEDSAALLPGSVMPYRQASSDKRKLIIAYLKTLAP